MNGGKKGLLTEHPRPLQRRKLAPRSTLKVAERQEAAQASKLKLQVPACHKGKKQARSAEVARLPRSAGCVGRIRISLTSTPGGCSRAKITARAMSSSLQRRLAGPVVEERRVGHPRLDQRHPDLVVVVHLAQLGAQRLADRGRRPLGRRVERAGQGAAAGDRAGDEEVAVAALEQVGEGGADRQRDAVDVGQDHRAPVLDRLLEEAARGAEAGVGEDRVDPAEALDRRPRPSPRPGPTR